jgi:hypothetical protein
MAPIPSFVETTIEVTISVPITIRFNWTKTDNGHPLPGTTGWSPAARYREYFIPIITGIAASDNYMRIGKHAYHKAQVMVEELDENSPLVTSALASCTPPPIGGDPAPDPE